MSRSALHPRAIAIMAAVAGVTLLLVANAHLVYVAIASQPGCVAHLKAEAGEPGAYRAARSSC